MKRVCAVACVLFLAGVCYGMPIKSNGTGGGKWSAGATWAGGVVPADGDIVSIVAGDTVTFDVDMAGWAHGIAGLTCNGTMQCSTLAGTYHLKTSADIGGTGTINCGSSEAVYPSKCTMTFNFDSKTNSFECGSGLTLNLFCAEPTYPVIALSGAGAAGQTALSVDTDVTGDIWAAGKTIRIDGISGSLPDSETRMIASGGIASDAITVSTGLAAAKASGARVTLVTRNIRIIGSTVEAVQSMTGGVIGCEISGCNYGVMYGSGCTISGTISGCNYGVVYGSGCTISGMISGCTYGVVYGSGCPVSGTISGCTYGVHACSGCAISGTISGCTYGDYCGSDCTISGTISGCSSGLYAGSGNIQAATFSRNTYDLRRVASVSAYNTTFGSTTENYEYDTDKVPQWTYVASYDHDGAAGAFRAWTRGGIVDSDARYGVSYKHTCKSSMMPCFRQESITVEPKQTLLVEGKIRIADDHSVWAPRLQLVDPGADPLVDAKNVPLASDVIPLPDGSFWDWQPVTVSYTNTGKIGRRVLIRCSAQRASGEVQEVWSTSLEQAVAP